MPDATTEQNQLTPEQEMARFTGFSTQDGVVRVEEKPAAADDKPAETVAEEDETEGDEVDEAADTAGAEDENAEDADDTEKQPEDEEPAPKKQPKGGRSARERINDITRERHRAERRAEEAEAARADAERRLAALMEKQQLTKEDHSDTVASNTPPKPEDFEYGELDGKYIDAMVEYKATKVVNERLEKIEQDRQAAAAAREVQEIQRKAEALRDKGAAKYKDFEVVVYDSPIIKKELTRVIHDLALNSEVGADIAYHLASNPKEARQIFGQSPIEQAASFGRLEAKFASASAAKPGKETPRPVKTTKAPPPAKAAKGAGGKTQMSPDTSDFTAFEALAAQQRE